MTNTNKVLADNKAEAKRLFDYGSSLIGKKCQSNVLTMISEDGQRKVPQPARLITECQVIFWCGEPALMLTVGGEDVFEDTCFNIK